MTAVLPPGGLSHPVGRPVTAPEGARVGAPVARATPGSRGAVPWTTVLVLTVVLGAADLWWLLVLRGAVGFIQRARSPFSVWATETVLWSPLVALGVLLGLTAARRRLDGAPGRRGASLTVVGGVVLGSSAVGVLLFAVQAVYDTALQRAQVAEMATMGGHACSAACLQRQLEAVGSLQVRALAVGVVLVVVTNAVLATWVWAAAGGRLRLAGAPPSAVRAGTVSRRVLAATLVGAAAIHLAVVPEHLTEWTAAGAFFLVLAVAELVAAAGVLRRLRGDLRLVVGVSVVPLLLWLVSRTVGMPIGPDPGTPEAVGPSDVVCCLLEAAALVAVAALTTSTPRPEAPPPVTTGRVLLLGVVVVTVVGLSWTGIPWLDAVGVVGGGGH